MPCDPRGESVIVVKSWQIARIPEIILATTQKIGDRHADRRGQFTDAGRRRRTVEVIYDFGRNACLFN